MFKLKKYDSIILIIFLVVFILSFMIIKSFLIPLIFTLILVYLLNPIYVRLKKIVFNCHVLASLLIISFFLLVTVLPISFGIVQLSKEFSYVQSDLIREKLDSFSLSLNQAGINLDLKEIFISFTSSLNEFLNSLLFQIPELFFHIFILFFFYFYFSKNFEFEFGFVKRVFNDKRFEIIGKKLEHLIYGVIYGQVVVRFIQALLFTLLYFFMGFQGAVFFGILTFLVAFIPVVGSGLIWFPLFIILLLQDQFLFASIFFILSIIISTIDNLLLPYFISERTNMGPVITLISIIGGLQLFGFYGVILGPFILGFFLVLLDEFLFSLRNQSPGLRKYIWSESERAKFRSLQTQKQKDDFIKKMALKHEKKNPEHI